MNGRLQSLFESAKEYVSYEFDKDWVQETLNNLRSGVFENSNYNEYFYSSPYEFALQTLKSAFERMHGKTEALLTFGQEIDDAIRICRNNPALSKTENDLNDALINVKADYLCIKNPKVFDAEGRRWNNVVPSENSKKRQGKSTRDLEK